MKVSLRALIGDFWHGFAWQLGSVGAKAWFLLFVFPALFPGALGEYIYIVSVSRIVSLVVILGSDVHLPLVVRGDWEASRRWLRVYLGFVSLAPACLLCRVICSESIVAILTLTAAFAAHSLLSGIVRSVKPAAQELLGNLHSLVFSALVTVPLLYDGAALGLVAAVALFIAQFAVLRVMGVGYAKWPSVGVSGREVLRAAQAGAIKLPSNLSLIFSLRGIVLWPKILFARTSSDTIGFAVSVGEALWKMGMVLVNRSYARFCKSETSMPAVVSETTIRGLLLIGVFLITGICLTAFGKNVLPWVGDIDWLQVGILMPMYGAVCGMFLIRYCLWSIYRPSAGLTYIIMGWAALQGLAIGILPVRYQGLGVVAGAFFALFASVTYARWQLKGAIKSDESRNPTVGISS